MIISIALLSLLLASLAEAAAGFKEVEPLGIGDHYH